MGRVAQAIKEDLYNARNPEKIRKGDFVFIRGFSRKYIGQVIAMYKVDGCLKINIKQMVNIKNYHGTRGSLIKGARLSALEKLDPLKTLIILANEEKL